MPDPENKCSSNPDSMAEKIMRWIYISPHLDDAVLSCGGLIWEQTQAGEVVEIWTVTAGDPPPGPVSDLVTRTHAKWNTGTPSQTVALRKIEDQNAARQVGASVRHLSQFDAIYRKNGEGLFLYTEDVFCPINPAENGIIEETLNQISQGLEDSDTIVCPLALGSHVDHVIVRAATERLKRPLLYYSDVPYLFNHENELTAVAAGLQTRHFSVSDQGLLAWQTGIEAYDSQLLSLFLDKLEMRAQISGYHARHNGQILWEKPE